MTQTTTCITEIRQLFIKNQNTSFLFWVFKTFLFVFFQRFINLFDNAQPRKFNRIDSSALCPLPSALCLQFEHLAQFFTQIPQYSRLHKGKREIMELNPTSVKEISFGFCNPFGSAKIARSLKQFHGPSVKALCLLMGDLKSSEKRFSPIISIATVFLACSIRGILVRKASQFTAFEENTFPTRHDSRRHDQDKLGMTLKPHELCFYLETIWDSSPT